jgi:small-conductance mechanosensitive channel
MLSSMSAFTLFHVVLSLVGIVAGLVVMAGLLRSRRLPGWTTLFLATTAATTATGFLFPFRGFTPALGVGAVSAVVLATTAYALYARRLAGRWRGTYVLGATVSLYLNVFVLVVQLFDKVPGLHALALTQQEPPFAIAQGVVLVLFAAMGFIAVRGFHPVVLPMDAHAT